MYVCMYACMYVCMYVLVSMLNSEKLGVSMYAYNKYIEFREIWVSMYVHMYVSMYTYTNVYQIQIHFGIKVNQSINPQLVRTCLQWR